MKLSALKNWEAHQYSRNNQDFEFQKMDVHFDSAICKLCIQQMFSFLKLPHV